MSDKYILRSGAIDAIKRNAGTLYTREAEFLFQKVIFLLKNAPAADVAPVVHGQWGDNGIHGSMRMLRVRVYLWGEQLLLLPKLRRTDGRGK